MSELPECVFVGPVTWLVREDALTLDRSRGTARDHRWAESDSKLAEMVLDPLLPPSRKREVLMHECVHALLYEFHVPTKGLEDEEALVESLGVAFLSLVRDNPELIKFMQEESV